MSTLTIELQRNTTSKQTTLQAVTTNDPLTKAGLCKNFAESKSEVTGSLLK